MNEILDGQMVTSGRALFSIIVLGLKDGGIDEIPTLLDRYVRLRRGGGDWTNHLSTDHIYDQEYYFQLVDPSGNTVFASQLPALLTESEQSTGFFKVEENGSEWHVFGLKDTNTQYTFFTGQSIDLRRQLSRESTEYIILPFVIGTPLILIAIWIGIGVGLSPISRISIELDSRQPDDMESLDTSDKVTELHPLIHAMNRLFNRVSTMLENERRFSADASHELRTPLAGIKANIDAARFYTDDPDLEKIHDNIERGVDNATNITEGLLLLSKLESSHTDEYFEKDTVDVYALVREEIVQLDQTHPDQNKRVIFTTMCVAGDALASGPTSLIRMLIRNILDNARRYSDPPDPIVISLQVENNITLNIEDSGPGIPVDEQTKVFQRFYRLDTNTANGSGLGLALSRQISESLGGTLTITNRQPAGLLVTIKLPLHPAMEAGMAAAQHAGKASIEQHTGQPGR